MRLLTKAVRMLTSHGGRHAALNRGHVHATRATRFAAPCRYRRGRWLPLSARRLRTTGTCRAPPRNGARGCSRAGWRCSARACLWRFSPEPSGARLRRLSVPSRLPRCRRWRRPRSRRQRWLALSPPRRRAAPQDKRRSSGTARAPNRHATRSASSIRRGRTSRLPGWKASIRSTPSRSVPSASTGC